MGFLSAFYFEGYAENPDRPPIRTRRAVSSYGLTHIELRFRIEPY